MIEDGLRSVLLLARGSGSCVRNEASGCGQLPQLHNGVLATGQNILK
jgi:hypothetical protein